MRHAPDPQRTDQKPVESHAVPSAPESENDTATQAKARTSSSLRTARVERLGLKARGPRWGANDRPNGELGCRTGSACVALGCYLHEYCKTKSRYWEEAECNKLKC